MRRKNTILLAFLMIISSMIASAQVTPVRAVASISPNPTWNRLYNGDFEQGTYSLDDKGNCPNSWIQGCSYYDLAYRGASHYDVIYDTQHGSFHSSPTDDDYRLEVKAYCKGDFWNNAWVQEKVQQYTGCNPITQATVFYGSIEEINIWEPGQAPFSAGLYRIVIYCHDDRNNIWTRVWIDYRLKAQDGSHNYPESRTQKIIDLLGNLGCWEGVSDFPTGYTGRSLYSDVHSKFDSEGFSNYYYETVECIVWAKCNWLADQYDTYAFDGVRIGDYPKPVPSSVSPTMTDEGDVGFSWSCDTPTCMFQDGFNRHYGVLRGGVSQYNLKVDSSHNHYSTSTSTTVDFANDGIGKGTYTPYVVAQRVDNSAWGPSSNAFSEVVNGYTLTVQTNWNYVPSASQSATLHYYQHSEECTIGVSDSQPVIVDPSSDAWIVAPSVSGSCRQVTTEDTNSWSDINSELDTQTVDYYGMYLATWSPSGLGGYSVDVQAMQFGSWSDKGSKSSAFDVWVDASGATNLKMDDTYIVTANKERYHVTTRNWTVSISPPYDTKYTANAQFIHQWQPTVTLSGTTSSRMVTVTYTLDGSQKKDINQYESWSRWVDNNAAVGFNATASGDTATRRWHTPTTSLTITDATAKTVTYYCQWRPTVTLAGTAWSRMVTVTFTSDGSMKKNINQYSSWSQWVDNNTAVSFNATASGDTTTRRWHTPTTSLTITNADLRIVTYYQQWKPTVTLSGTSSTRRVNVTYSQDGSPWTDFNVYGSWSGWVDDNMGMSLTALTTGSSSTRRWHTPTTSLTITDANPRTVIYYQQWKPYVTIEVNNPAGAGTVNASWTQDGMTNRTTGLSASWSWWVDNSGWVNFTALTTGGNPTKRWHTPDTSLTIADATAKTVTYYQQWKPTVTLSGTSSTRRVNATYTKDGSPWIDFNVYGSWNAWVDNGRVLSFTALTTGSGASERWRTYGASWTITSATTPPASITYIHQYWVSLDPRDEAGSPLSRIVDVQYTGDDGSNGANGTYTATFSSLWSRWMNAETTLRTGKLASGSNSTDQWYCYDGSLNGNWRERTVSPSTTYTLTYYHQFRSEIELYTNQYGQKVYDNSWYLSPCDWVKATAWLSGFDTQPPITGTYTFTFTDPSNTSRTFDGSATGSCFYQIPQARGEWKLQVTWDDGNGVIYNKTMSFYVWDYDAGFQSLVQSGDNLNLTVYVNQLSGTASATPTYWYVVVLNGGSGSTVYTNATGFTFAKGFMNASATSVSTKFFFQGTAWVWSAHIANLDPYLGHVVGMRVLVVDPITGYIYANTTSTRSLSIGGEGDIQR